MFRTGAQMAILVLLTGMFVLWTTRNGPVKALEDVMQGRLEQTDARGREFGAAKGLFSKPSLAPVFLVAINDNSVANHPWPWTPLDFSLFAQGVVSFHPEVVAIGEVINWDRTKLAPVERQKLPQYEKILGDALLRCPKLLLAAELGSPDDPTSPPALREAPFIRSVKGALDQVPEWSTIEHEAKEDFRLSANIGFTNLPLANQSRSSVPMVFRFQGRVVPSFALQALVLWQKLSLDDVSVVLGSHLAMGENFKIPIDAHGEMLVNFSAPPSVVGFDELLLANEQIAANQKSIVPVERIAQSVVMLARTDKGAEKISFANGRSGTAGELFAAAIATVQSKAFIQPAGTWVSWILLAVATLLGAGTPYWRKKTVALAALGLLLIYFIAWIVLFDAARLVLPALLPLALALFIVLYRWGTPNRVWTLRRPVIF